MDSSSKTISDLPNEILVMIFEKLNKMSDIVSIKNTCTKWENVIEMMFNFEDKGMFITYNLLKTIFAKRTFKKFDRTTFMTVLIKNTPCMGISYGNNVTLCFLCYETENSVI